MTDSEKLELGEGALISTFMLGDAVFGARASEIQEIVLAGDIAKVYNAPAFVLGMRNLRGRIITVINLAARLGLRGATGNSREESRLLIAESRGESIGLFVDRVSDTVVAEKHEISPPPPDMNGISSRFLWGVYQGHGRVAALLDLDAALDAEA